MQINPTAPQDKFIFSLSKYPAIVAGFGAGKTEALIVRAILGKIQYPKNDRAFYEPTYDLIRMIAWPRFEELLSELHIPYRLTKNPINVLEIEGYGRIVFRSMDTPNRIIGYEVGDSDVDELDTLKKEDAANVWRRILSRNRQKKPNGDPNTVGVATTPEGFRFVYDTWHVKKLPGYEIIKASSYSNPHLPEDYIQSLRDIYPPNLLDAYIEGEFVNLTTGTVYTGFNRALNATSEEARPREPLHIGMDFNVGKMSAVIHVLRNGKAFAVDEVWGVMDTPAMISELQDRYQDHSIIVYPDASGKGRKTINASTSDLQLLKDARFRVVVDLSNPGVRDRVTAMNAAFCNASGERKYLVNIERCPNYTLCLEQQAYDKNGAPDKQNDFDHLPEAGGYFIAKQFPVIKRQAQMIKMVGH